MLCLKCDAELILAKINVREFEIPGFDIDEEVESYLCPNCGETPMTLSQMNEFYKLYRGNHAPTSPTTDAPELS